MKASLPTAALSLALSACGSGGSSNQSSAPAAASPQMTMALDSSASLPACDDTHENQLVYLMDVKEFKSCKSGSWVSIEIRGEAGKDGAKGTDGTSGKDGADGLRISSIWTYSDNSFTGADALSEGGFTFIGDIRVISFSDESYNIMVNGQTLLDETSGDVGVNDFTHTFFLPKGVSVESAKLTTYADSVAYYALRIANAAPVLDITIDTDGNINNNTITTYLLNKNWPSSN